MVKRINKVAIATLAAATMFLATACSSGGASGVSPSADASTGTSDLVAAAQHEGQLVFYGDGNEASLQKWTQGFTEKYNIKVSILRLPGSQLYQRFAQESSAGQHQSDIFSVADQASLDKAVEQKWLANYTPKEGGLYPPANTRSGYYYPVQNLYYQTVTFNKDKLLSDEIAMIRKDPMKAVGDSRFKDRIGVNMPQSSQQIAALWYMFTEGTAAKGYGWSAMEKIAANKPGIFSSLDLVNKVIAGEYAIGVGITDSLAAPLALQGAPIEFAYITPRTVGGAFGVGISAGAPHPNAARLFMEWATTPASNELYSNTTQTAPANSKAKDERKLLSLDWYTKPDQSKVWLDFVTDKTFLKDAGADGDFLAHWNKVFGYAG